MIVNDKADLASRSASSLPRMLVWLGSGLGTTFLVQHKNIPCDSLTNFINEALNSAVGYIEAVL